MWRVGESHCTPTLSRCCGALLHRTRRESSGEVHFTRCLFPALRWPNQLLTRANRRLRHACRRPRRPRAQSRPRALPATRTRRPRPPSRAGTAPPRQSPYRRNAFSLWRRRPFGASRPSRTSQLSHIVRRPVYRKYSPPEGFKALKAISSKSALDWDDVKDDQELELFAVRVPAGVSSPSFALPATRSG